jgi:hypothetical protein
VRRFVILEHDHPHLHWDLMLESGNALRTWRLAEPPSPRAPVRAEAIGDHRLMYLDYEGPLTGNRGSVRRWDAGTFEWLSEGKSACQFRLAGNRVRGVFSLANSDCGPLELTQRAAE